MTGTVANVFIDYDGTLADRGQFMPGAVAALKEILAAGHHVTIYSAGLNTTWLNGAEKSPSQYLASRANVRAALDVVGLRSVDIYEGDKPAYDLLIDDRSMRFPGRPGSWRRIIPAVLTRLEAR